VRTLYRSFAMQVGAGAVLPLNSKKKKSVASTTCMHTRARQITKGIFVDLAGVVDSYPVGSEPSQPVSA
jgi:hypothetical protein